MRERDGESEKKKKRRENGGKKIILSSFWEKYNQRREKGKKEKTKEHQRIHDKHIYEQLPQKEARKKKSHLASREAVGGAVKDQRHYRHTLSRFFCFLFIFKNK